MNALLAASCAAGTTLLFWRIAAVAAGRRNTSIGTLPLLLPAATAAAAGLAALAGTPAGVIAATAGAAVAGIVDARTWSIFDPLTASLLAAALGLAALEGRLIDAFAGSICIAGGLFILRLAGRGRGVGLGDVKLGAGLGAALGAPAGITAIALAFIFGGAYGAWLLATKRAMPGHSIRFGPYIAAGVFAALLTPPGHLR
jgi:leader peptidase (prepilin peptidase)/N-methyltransferase